MTLREVNLARTTQTIGVDALKDERSDFTPKSKMVPCGFCAIILPRKAGLCYILTKRCPCRFALRSHRT